MPKSATTLANIWPKTERAMNHDALHNFRFWRVAAAWPLHLRLRNIIGRRNRFSRVAIGLRSSPLGHDSTGFCTFPLMSVQFVQRAEPSIAQINGRTRSRKLTRGLALCDQRPAHMAPRPTCLALRFSIQRPVSNQQPQSFT